MGVNFPDIRYIFTWGAARSLLDFHQEAGRAGRDGVQSRVVVLYRARVCCCIVSLQCRCILGMRAQFLIKEIKNAPSALLSYISTREFLRTREK